MTLLEILVGPLLVYAAGFEAPPLFSVYGGVMLVVALLLHSLAALREERMIQQCDTDSVINGPLTSEIKLEVDSNDMTLGIV
jgi:hypothetical protein